MGKIFDYNSFNSMALKKQENRLNGHGEYSFISEILYTKIDVYNLPSEITEISEKKAVIEYKANLDIKKSGIDDISIFVSNIELELNVFDESGEDREFDFTLEPGKTVSYDQIVVIKEDNIIPTEPTRISIDMKKSMEMGKFLIKVNFGRP